MHLADEFLGSSDLEVVFARRHRYPVADAVILKRGEWKTLHQPRRLLSQMHTREKATY